MLARSAERLASALLAAPDRWIGRPCNRPRRKKVDMPSGRAKTATDSYGERGYAWLAQMLVRGQLIKSFGNQSEKAGT